MSDPPLSPSQEALQNKKDPDAAVDATITSQDEVPPADDNPDPVPPVTEEVAPPSEEIPDPLPPAAEEVAPPPEEIPDPLPPATEEAAPPPEENLVEEPAPALEEKFYTPNETPPSEPTEIPQQSPTEIIMAPPPENLMPPTSTTEVPVSEEIVSPESQTTDTSDPEKEISENPPPEISNAIASASENVMPPPSEANAKAFSSEPSISQTLPSNSEPPLPDNAIPESLVTDTSDSEKATSSKVDIGTSTSEYQFPPAIKEIGTTTSDTDPHLPMSMSNKADDWTSTSAEKIDIGTDTAEDDLTEPAEAKNSAPEEEAPPMPTTEESDPAGESPQEADPTANVLDENNQIESENTPSNLPEAEIVHKPTRVTFTDTKENMEDKDKPQGNMQFEDQPWKLEKYGPYFPPELNYPGPDYTMGSGVASNNVLGNNPPANVNFPSGGSMQFEDQPWKLEKYGPYFPTEFNYPGPDYGMESESTNDTSNSMQGTELPANPNFSSEGNMEFEEQPWKLEKYGAFFPPELNYPGQKQNFLDPNSSTQALGNELPPNTDSTVNDIGDVPSDVEPWKLEKYGAFFPPEFNYPGQKQNYLDPNGGIGPSGSGPTSDSGPNNIISNSVLPIENYSGMIGNEYQPPQSLAVDDNYFYCGEINYSFGDDSNYYYGDGNGYFYCSNAPVEGYADVQQMNTENDNNTGQGVEESGECSCEESMLSMSKASQPVPDSDNYYSQFTIQDGQIQGNICPDCGDKCTQTFRKPTFTESAIAFLDTLASIESVPCNTCDKPESELDCEEEVSSWVWLCSILKDIYNDIATTTKRNCNENDKDAGKDFTDEICNGDDENDNNEVVIPSGWTTEKPSAQNISQLPAAEKSDKNVSDLSSAEKPERNIGDLPSLDSNIDYTDTGEWVLDKMPPMWDNSISKGQVPASSESRPSTMPEIDYSDTGEWVLDKMPPMWDNSISKDLGPSSSDDRPSMASKTDVPVTVENNFVPEELVPPMPIEQKPESVLAFPPEPSAPNVNNEQPQPSNSLLPTENVVESSENPEDGPRKYGSI